MIEKNEIKTTQNIKGFNFKSFTRDGDKAKFIVNYDFDNSIVLITTRYLTKKNTPFIKLNYQLKKKFKDYYLFQNKFPIKLESFKKIATVLFYLIEKEANELKKTADK